MRISGPNPDDGDDVIGIAVVEPAEASVLVSLADQLQALLAESLVWIVGTMFECGGREL